MSKVINKSKKIAVVGLMLLMIMAALAPSVYARDLIDTGRGGTLTACMTGDASNVEGMEFRAYRVGEFDDTSDITPTDRFSGYGIDFSGISNQEDWRLIGETVKAYIAGDSLTADYTAKTDANGKAAFGSVETGVYLILADRYEFNERIYTADLSMVAVPSLTVDEEWEYNVEFNVKHSSEPAPEFPGTGGLEVVKVWADEDDTNRPESIDVQLICDGELKETVKLDKTNGWKYSWTNLENGKEYSVTETVPEGYEVTISRDDDLVTITNKPVTKTPPPTTTTTTNPPKLPQTGQDWIPSIVLSICGIMFIGIGFLIRRKES